jgi:hypothetical protein
MRGVGAPKVEGLARGIHPYHVPMFRNVNAGRWGA